MIDKTTLPSDCNDSSLIKLFVMNESKQKIFEVERLCM